MEQIEQATGKNLYRYNNSFGHPVLREYSILRETKGGKWIRDWDNTEHWVSNYSKKRFAYPTKKEALINFIKRTERHIMLVKGNLERAKEALDRAKVKQREMEGKVNENSNSRL